MSKRYNSCNRYNKLTRQFTGELRIGIEEVHPGTTGNYFQVLGNSLQLPGRDVLNGHLFQNCLF